MKCPTGGEYVGLCTHKGRDVSCWIVKSLKSAPGGCIDLEGLRRPLLQEVEEEYAQRILGHLSEKYGVKKPDLVLLDQCPSKNPESYGIYKAVGEKREISVCRGGVNVHVLGHEFAHNMQNESGKPLSEHEAEQAAKREALSLYEHSDQKPLNVEGAHNTVGDDMAVMWRPVAMIYGGQHIAKGLERGFVEVDRYTGRSAAAVQERPSTWLNIGLGVGLPLVAVFGKIRSPYDTLMVLMGGHFSTKIWDYGEEVMTGVGGGGAARVVYVPATTPGAVSVAGGGRFQITG